MAEYVATGFITSGFYTQRMDTNNKKFNSRFVCTSVILESKSKFSTSSHGVTAFFIEERIGTEMLTERIAEEEEEQSPNSSMAILPMMCCCCCCCC